MKNTTASNCACGLAWEHTGKCRLEKHRPLCPVTTNNATVCLCEDISTEPRPVPFTCDQKDLEVKGDRRRLIEMVNEKYFVGIDLAYRMKWWQKLLVFLRLVKREKFQDYIYSTVFKRHKDGSLEVVDINLF